MEEHTTPFDQLDDDRFPDLLRSMAGHCATAAREVLPESGEASVDYIIPDFANDDLDRLVLASYIHSMGDTSRAIAAIWVDDLASHRAIATLGRSLVETAGAIAWLLSADSPECRLCRACLCLNQSIVETRKMVTEEAHREALERKRQRLTEVRKATGKADEYPHNSGFVKCLELSDHDKQLYAVLCANAHPDSLASIAYLSNRHERHSIAVRRARESAAVFVTVVGSTLEKVAAKFGGPVFDALDRDLHALLVETFGKRG